MGKGFRGPGRVKGWIKETRLKLQSLIFSICKMRHGNTSMLGLRDSLLGKVFACIKDPSLIPRTSIAMPGMGSKSYDPRVENVEREESLGLASQPVEPN